MSIHFKNVNYIYQQATPFEQQALFDISLTIPSGSYTAIIGHTGSGKSTLLQHLNGLLKPTSGQITIEKQIITPTTKNKALSSLRKQVGIVFQFPEAQLFEETVLKDIAFGPKNFGSSEQEATQLARQMAHLVNLPEELLEKSPFELSGGQMRRVAIAGILAMEPQVLVLDEPTAGLDPRGRAEIMEIFQALRIKQHLTIILVTHQMDDVARYANHVIVLEKGRLLASGTPTEIFSDPDWLRTHHLALPQATRFARALQKKSGFEFSKMPLTEEELANQLVQQLGKRG